MRPLTPTTPANTGLLLPARLPALVPALLPALVALLVLPLAPAQAVQSGRTEQGVSFVSGGVSHEELRELHAQRDRYSLWVVTAATKSGAHLADVALTIREDATRRVVFTGRMDGPWLFVALAPGRYEVEAALDDQVHRRRTSIQRGEHRQLFFYFDTADEVSPEERSPFERNPYG